MRRREDNDGDGDDRPFTDDPDDAVVGVVAAAALHTTPHDALAEVTADVADLVQLRRGVVRTHAVDTAVTRAGGGGGDDNAANREANAEAAAAAERQRQLVHQRNSEAARARGGRSVNTVVDARQRLMRDLRVLQQSMMQAAAAAGGGAAASSSASSSSGGGNTSATATAAAATSSSLSSSSPSLGGLCMSAHPVDNDIFHWHAVIAGPSETPWEGGLFRLDLQFSESYPVQPPHVRFLTRGVFHPNVYVDGNICLDTLKSSWSPMLDVQALLLSITSLLSDPNPASAANGEAARLLTESKERYNRRVRQLVEESLEQSISDDDDDDDDDEQDK